MYRGVCVTSDGFFLGMAHGDIGYNNFLGKPNPKAGATTDGCVQEAWAKLNQAECEVMLSNPHIKQYLQDSGVIS